MNNNTLYFPPEWHPQDAILMALPHENSDWLYMLDEAKECYFHIINAISQSGEAVILLVNNRNDYKYSVNKFDNSSILCFRSFSS